MTGEKDGIQVKISKIKEKKRKLKEERKELDVKQARLEKEIKQLNLKESYSELKSIEGKKFIIEKDRHEKPIKLRFIHSVNAEKNEWGE